MNIMVSPNSSFSLHRRLMICDWIDTSNADIGSSQMRSSGSMASALAIQILCLWPPENSWG